MRKGRYDLKHWCYRAVYHILRLSSNRYRPLAVPSSLYWQQHRAAGSEHLVFFITPMFCISIINTGCCMMAFFRQMSLKFCFRINGGSWTFSAIHVAIYQLTTARFGVCVWILCSISISIDLLSNDSERYENKGWSTRQSCFLYRISEFGRYPSEFQKFIRWSVISTI